MRAIHFWLARLRYEFHSDEHIWLIRHFRLRATALHLSFPARIGARWPIYSLLILEYRYAAAPGRIYFRISPTPMLA